MENLLEINVYVYTCDKNLSNKAPLYKSDKNYEKFLDLLLFESNFMNIKRIDLFFKPGFEKQKIVETFVTSFSQKSNIMNHIKFCQNQLTNDFITFKKINIWNLKT